MIVAAVLIFVAMWLVARPEVGPGPARARPTSAPGGAVLALVGLAVLTGRPAWTVQAGVVVVVSLAVRAVVRRRRVRRTLRASETALLSACELIAADLRAGLTAEAALARAAVDWPALAPVAAAARIGADVPHAWRAAAPAAGRDLVLVAASWQVSHRSGGALAGGMTRVAARLRAARSTRAIVDSELASARATARLMAGLPALALAMGGGLGGDPLGFLFGTTAGLGCLAAGVLLNLLGLWWIDGIADSIADSA